MALGDGTGPFTKDKEGLSAPSAPLLPWDVSEPVVTTFLFLLFHVSPSAVKVSVRNSWRTWLRDQVLPITGAEVQPSNAYLWLLCQMRTTNAIDKTELGPHDLALTLACDICSLCYICFRPSIPDDD